MCNVILAKDMINSDTAVDRIRTALLQTSEAERFLLMAKIEINKNPKLQQCDGVSVLACLVTAAKLGLYIGSGGEAFLVPYKDTCTLQIGWQGMLKLLYRSGLKAINANVVYSNDEFEYIDGSEANIKHRRKFVGDRGNFVCAYAIAKINGEQMIEIMDKAEIDFIRSKSMASNSMPWKDFYDEMAKKTVIRRLFKRMPKEGLDLQTLEAINNDERLVEANDNAVNDDQAVALQQIAQKSEDENVSKSDALAAVI